MASISQLNIDGVMTELHDYRLNLDAHSHIFRGACLNGSTSTSYPTMPIVNRVSLLGRGYSDTQIKTMISNGTFSDIYIGDYIQKSYGGKTVNFRVAGINTEYNKGDTALTTNHVVLVPDVSLADCQWNTSDTTSGGYQASNIHKYCVETVAANLASAFSGYTLLTCRDLTTVSTGTWDWESAKCRLMSEMEVYGSNVWSMNGYQTGTANSRFPLFTLRPELATGLHYDYWLQNVSTSTRACRVNNGGHAGDTSANSNYGVRPRFLIG